MLVLFFAMSSLENKLEALLFYRGEAETKETIAQLLEVSVSEVESTARQLSTSLANRGIRLLMVENELELVSAPETSDMVAKLRKDELSRDLGKAGAETLSIVLYRGPVTKTQIEYIRGVNCSFVLRSLLIRGLVERVPNPEHMRSTLYRATPELLKHLGVTSVSELPEFGRIQAEIAVFEKQVNSGEGVDVQEPSHSDTEELDILMQENTATTQNTPLTQTSKETF